jgi:spermidine synthase
MSVSEYKSIEPCLETWAREPSSRSLTYIVGDAMEYLRERDEQFDVVYFSGFTPEETRRGDVQQRYAGTLSRRAHLRLAKWMHGNAPTWPQTAEPFGPYETEAIRNRLRDGGLFISQSYYRGVPLHQNPHYLECMRQQLQSLGLQLISYYTFPHPYTDVALAVALKGTSESGRDYCKTSEARAEITRFHGRSDVATGIVIHRFNE